MRKYLITTDNYILIDYRIKDNTNTVWGFKWMNIKEKDRWLPKIFGLKQARLLIKSIDYNKYPDLVWFKNVKISPYNEYYS